MVFLSHNCGLCHITSFTFIHLADAFIQSDLQLRNVSRTLWVCLAIAAFSQLQLFLIIHMQLHISQLWLYISQCDIISHNCDLKTHTCDFIPHSNLAVLSSVFMTLFLVILSLSLFCNYNFVSSKRNLTYLKTVTFYLTMWLYFAIMTLFHVNVTSYLKIATFLSHSVTIFSNFKFLL